MSKLNTGKPETLSSVFESLDYASVKARILGVMQDEEKYLLGLRDRLVRNNRSARALDNRDVALSRARLYGAMNVATSIGIDCSPFQWIHDL